jgi:hypothetical protein
VGEQRRERCCNRGPRGIVAGAAHQHAQRDYNQGEICELADHSLLCRHRYRRRVRRRQRALTGIVDTVLVFERAGSETLKRTIAEQAHAPFEHAPAPGGDSV